MRIRRLLAIVTLALAAPATCGGARATPRRAIVRHLAGPRARTAAAAWAPRSSLHPTAIGPSALPSFSPNARRSFSGPAAAPPANGAFVGWTSRGVRISPAGGPDAAAAPGRPIGLNDASAQPLSSAGVFVGKRDRAPSSNVSASGSDPLGSVLTMISNLFSSLTGASR